MHSKSSQAKLDSNIWTGIENLLQWTFSPRIGPQLGIHNPHENNRKRSAYKQSAFPLRSLLTVFFPADIMDTLQKMPAKNDSDPEVSGPAEMEENDDLRRSVSLS